MPIILLRKGRENVSTVSDLSHQKGALWCCDEIAGLNIDPGLVS